MAIALEQEYKFFVSRLQDLAKTHLHEFVLIKGKQIVGFFTSYDQALREGLSRFGNVPFFIEEVKKEEEPHYFYHGLG